MCQGDIELDLALERALALPASEDFARANRGFLENFQAITQAAVEIAIEVQVAVLVAVDVGDIDTDVTDLGNEQQAMVGLDAHTAVLNQHIAINLLHLRPAGLEVQRRIAHLEEQADTAGLRGGAVVQRTLVLEVALIHGALDDRTAQPFVEGRAQHFGQVLSRVATIAVGQADPQVHVVLAALFEQQADKEVTGDLALLAQHLEVGRDEGEAFLVEGPGQAGIGLQVMPRFGENRVQVQHEGVSIEPQFSMAQVATDAATDVTGRRGTVIGIETDLFQVGGKLQTLVALGLGPRLQAYVAQRTGDLQAIDHRHEVVRQRRQGIDHRGQRGEVEAVGLHFPAFFRGILAWALTQLKVGFPSGLADIHGQGIDHHVKTLFVALEPGGQRQVVQGGGLALGIGPFKLGSIEPDHRLLQLAFAPIDPELAPRTQRLGMPLA
ncbi:hypothetical protein D3C81_896700 [compost metagenome]